MNDDYEVEVAYGSSGQDTVAPLRPAVADESEFSRFEELASKLVQVPKSELDEKRQTA